MCSHTATASAPNSDGADDKRLTMVTTHEGITIMKLKSAHNLKIYILNIQQLQLPDTGMCYLVLCNPFYTYLILPNASNPCFFVSIGKTGVLTS